MTKKKACEHSYLPQLGMGHRQCTQCGLFEKKEKAMAKNKLTLAEQARVRGWCAGWFTMDPSRRSTLVEWVMLKLGVTQTTAQRYAGWLEEQQVEEAAKKAQPKRQPVADPEGKNEDRAEWARAAVDAFRAETGLDEDDGLDTAISDLLADIAHLCDAEGLDLGHLLSRAENHYTEETCSEQSEDAEEVDGRQFNRIDLGRVED